MNSLGGVFDLQQPAATRYLPCPRLLNHYWGDYFDSIVIPGTTYGFPTDIGIPFSTPWMITAHADSRYGCELQSIDRVQEQHVEAVVW